jgi:hypothetical protein
VVTNNPVSHPVLANWPDYTGLPGIFAFFKIPASTSFKGWRGEWILKRSRVPWIRRHDETRLAPAAPDKAVAGLDHPKRSTDRRAAARDHLAALRMRCACAHS